MTIYMAAPAVLTSSWTSVYLVDPTNYPMPKILREGDTFMGMILNELFRSRIYVTDDFYNPYAVIAKFLGEAEITEDLLLAVNPGEFYYDAPVVAFFKADELSLPRVYGLPLTMSLWKFVILRTYWPCSGLL